MKQYELTQAQIDVIKQGGDDIEDDLDCPFTHTQTIICEDCQAMFKGLKDIDGNILDGCHNIWLTNTKICNRIDALIRRGTLVIKN